MEKISKCILATVVTLSGWSPAFGQQTENKLNTTVKEETTKKRNYSVGLGLTYTSNLYKEGTYESEKGLRIRVIPAYKFSDYLTLSSIISVEQQMTPPENTILSNTPVSLSYSRYQLAHVINITNKLTAVLPTNKDIAKQDSYRGTISLGNDFSYTFESVPLKSAYGIALGRNIHEYKRNFMGAPNIEYSLTHSASLQLNLTKTFDFSTLFFYKQARTYNGFERSAFFTMATLNYDYNKDLRLSIGTSNEGNALKANGRDSNITLFNEHSSTVFGGISYEI